MQVNNNNKSFYDHLNSLKVIAQVNHEEEFKEICQGGPFDHNGNRLSCYVGFDPTAKSLHVGHLVQLQMLRKAQDFGFTPIVLFGGATGLIGDPTDKTEMRPMNTPEQIQEYIGNFSKLCQRYFREDVENPPIFVNNIDWVGGMTWLDFMRTVGVQFTVARLLAADVNRSRFEAGGLTFMELGYQLLQAWDFVQLYKRYGCVMQFGGNDQWSNCLAGADLIRRLEQGKAFALTTPLVTDSKGSKLGKTAGNAVWLDGDLLSPYDFFQYFRNLDDSVIERVYTLYFDDEIQNFQNRVNEDINQAKEHLAWKITTLVHGEAHADKAKEAAKALFQGGGNLDSAPRSKVSIARLEEGLDLVALMVETGLCKSKGEARRLIGQGGVQLNGEKAADPSRAIVGQDFETEQSALVIKKGKKVFHLVELGQ